MGLYDYENKRDEDGTLLVYSAFRMMSNISDLCLIKLRKYDVYKKLVNGLGNKYVEMYFDKFFFEECKELASKIVLYKWHLRNVGTDTKEIILVPNISWIALLKEVWPDPSVKWEVQGSYNSSIHQFKVFLNAKSRKMYRKFQESMYNYPSVKFDINGRHVIAISLTEGTDLSKRSDLFWFSNSNIDPASVIVYIESRSLLEKHGKAKDVIKEIEHHGFNWITLFKDKYEFGNNYWQPEINACNSSIESIRESIKMSQPTDKTEKWLKIKTENMLNRINYWYSFFNEFDVKVHYDPTEYGLKNIEKKIALDLLDGCSIGKVRSYPTLGKEAYLYCAYPNDVFFCYGKDSAEHHLETNNVHRNILLSGFPYGNAVHKVKEEVSEVRKTIEANGAKLVLLLLDEMHGMNKNLVQFVYKPEIKRFYEYFLHWVLDDKEIGLVIKSKKAVVFENLAEIHTLLEKAESTGRCHNVFQPGGVKASDWTETADFAVAISCVFSGALMEAVIAGCRGIFYDFPGYYSKEYGPYAWIDNKVIFRNFEEMVEELKQYKNDPSRNPGLGDWSVHMNELDPFSDGLGGERIGTYMRWLQEGFDESLDRDLTIDRANKLYADCWGEDKVYFTEKTKAALSING